MLKEAKKIASYKQNTRRLPLECKSASPPTQETEIKVGAQMFPEQINLDYASSGRKAEKKD